MITSKQRAYLKSIACNEDTILMIGKNNISENVLKQADDALNAREIIKGKVLETADFDVNHIANQISESLNSDVVQVIGNKFVLYRKNNTLNKIKLPKGKK